MTRKKNFISVVALAAILFLSMSSNYENPTGKAGVNGSPGEQTCAKSGCHDSYALNSGTGSVTLAFPDMPGNVYVPGQTYTVQVTHYFGGQSNFWAKIAAMSVLGTLPIFIIVGFMQRYLVRGISLGAVKG